MIVQCPNCRTRYRIREDHLKGRKLLLRCGRCQERFQTESAESDPLVSPSRDETPPAVKPEKTEKARSTNEESPFTVLIADEARGFRNRILTFFSERGADIITVEDGIEAWEKVRKEKPRLAFINVYLPRLLGFEICERIKALPDLRDIKVILIGALFRTDRFRRKPESFYGADEYLEDVMEPPELERFLESVSPSSFGGDMELAVIMKKARRAKRELESIKNEDAKRLARTILSDLLIYNTDLVEEGIKNNSFHKLLKSDLSEGHEYFSKRFPPSDVAGKDVFGITVEEYVSRKRMELLTSK